MHAIGYQATTVTLIISNTTLGETIMNSINENQPEHNYEDLSGTAAVEKIKQIIDKAESCFFSTEFAVAGSCGTRPMGVQEGMTKEIFGY